MLARLYAGRCLVILLHRVGRALLKTDKAINGVKQVFQAVFIEIGEFVETASEGRSVVGAIGRQGRDEVVAI